mmetsp:Transcript_77195/g.136087  ORF Transcript_77195/g.136087 Transcript_77195/m.136087 type:complete len:172 (-) Transcript_77195:33-548(-)
MTARAPPFRWHWAQDSHVFCQPGVVTTASLPTLPHHIVRHLGVFTGMYMVEPTLIYISQRLLNVTNLLCRSHPSWQPPRNSAPMSTPAKEWRPTTCRHRLGPLVHPQDSGRALPSQSVIVVHETVLGASVLKPSSSPPPQRISQGLGGRRLTSERLRLASKQHQLQIKRRC